MNGLTKTLIGIGVGYITLKLMATRPIKRYVLAALVDGAYIIVKKKLKD